MKLIDSTRQRLTALILLAIMPLLTACDEVSVVVTDGEDPEVVIPPPDPDAPVTSPILLSLGDLNGDGIQDIAVVIDDVAGGKLTATVKGIDGNVVQRLPYNGEFRLQTAMVLPDMNGDGGVELAVFGRRADPVGMRVEIRDPLAGGLIRNIFFSNENTLLFTTPVDDLNGDSYPEITALLEGPQPEGLLFGQSVDPLAGGVINNVFFDNAWPAVDFISLPDINSSGSPEFALLGHNVSGEYRALVRDAGNSQFVNNISYGSQYTLLQLAALPDMNGNGIEELAALRQDNAVSIQINDAFNGTRISVVRFNPLFTPLKFVVVSDFNGNGAPELALLSKNTSTGEVKAEVRDAMTGVLLSNVWWTRDYPALDIVTIPDTNGNGAEELVALGKRESDGKLLVLVKDSKTNQLLGTVGFKNQP